MPDHIDLHTQAAPGGGYSGPVTRPVLPFVALFASAACYAPHPQPGASCASAPCPSGLECAPATQTCELPGGGGGDAAGPPVDASPCFGTGLVRLCLATPPTQPVTFGSSTTLDTDTSPACAPYDGTGLCVVAGTGVVIGAPLRATGSRPLVIASAGSIIVGGDLDVASRRVGSTMSPGAGAMAPGALCVAGDPPAQKGGGPGGSFGGRGGDGGIGATTSAAAAPAVTAVTALRGGCAGRAGHGTNPGAGGAGGGAVYLIARGGIVIGASINASGAGGGGALADGGGGGGGSGGMIGLDAPTISVAAPVFANGGGGGEGGGMLAGNNGGTPGGATQPAPGGNGGAPNGGDGGAGSAGANKAGGRGGDNTATAGGGGGGGGAGIILVFPGPLSGGTNVSPPPT